MDIRNCREWKARAGEALGGMQFSPRRLALLHAGAAAGLSVLLALVNLFLQKQVDAAVGLSGLGMRSMLETAQSVLQLVVALAMPFWEMGLVYAALRMARHQQAEPRDLPEGFRRFGPILRLELLRGMLYFGIGMICLYAASFLFSISPLAKPALELLTPYVQNNNLDALMQDEAAVQALSRAAMPATVIFAVLFLIAAVPVFYRLRLASYALLDNPQGSALAALRTSGYLTRGNRMSLFRLDLSFWWFYLLQLALLALCYGDVLLGLCGITLPMSANLSYILFLILSNLGQLALYWWAGSYVETTYATAYDTLLTQPAVPPVPAPTKTWEV